MESNQLNFRAKLLWVQSNLKTPKTRFNGLLKSSYRSAEDILSAVKPLLNEIGLVMMIYDEVVEIGERTYVKSTVNVYDVETREEASSSGWAREAEEKKGLDVAQITGAASSYARKYALNGLLLLDDSIDPDATTSDNIIEDIEAVETMAELARVWTKMEKRFPGIKNDADVMAAFSEKKQQLINNHNDD